MAQTIKGNNSDLDMAEIYRQHYEDALDEIRNLRFEVSELKTKNNILLKGIREKKNQ